MSPVTLVTIHHQGGGAPTDNSGGYSHGGYTYGIGKTRWEHFRSVWDSFATLNFNGESVDVCLSGDRHTGYPVTDADIELIRGAVADARSRGYVVGNPTVRAHQDSPGSATACPGNYTMNVWNKVVAACQAGSQPTTPTTDEDGNGGAMDIVMTPSGNGYYVVDSVGAVFAYGDAQYRGGANDLKLAAPIVGMDVRPNNDGYWLVASDGGVFAYGAAPMRGGMGGKKLNAPVCALSSAEDGNGYVLLAKDGGVFAFGSALFLGAPTGHVN